MTARVAVRTALLAALLAALVAADAVGQGRRAPTPAAPPSACRAGGRTSGTVSALAYAERGAVGLAIDELEAGAGDSASRYAAHAVTEELTRLLTRARGVAVVPPRRLSVIDRSAGQGIGTLLAALGVHWTLAGTVLRQARTMRTSVTLLHDGRPVWVRTTARPIVELPIIAADLAQRALASMRLPPAPGPVAAFTVRDTIAFDAYLHGRFALAQPGRASPLGAVRAFELATSRDPTFVAAWAGTTRAYRALLDRGVADPRFGRDSVIRRAVRAADRVLALDPRSAEGWALGAELLMTVNPPRLAATRDVFERAIRLDARDAEVHDAYGRALMLDGDLDGAEASYLRALALEPFRAGTLVDLAELRATQGRYADACTVLNDAVAADAWSTDAYASRALVRLRVNDLRSAWSDAEVVSRLGNRVRGEAIAAQVDVAALDARRARARLQALRATGALPASGGPPEDLVALASAYVAVRDTATAYRLLEQVGVGSARLAFELRRPELAALRDDRHFAQLRGGRPPRP